MNNDKATSAVLGLVDPANAWSSLWKLQGASFDSQTEFQDHLRNTTTFDEYVGLIKKLDEKDRGKLIGKAISQGQADIVDGSYRQRCLRISTGKDEVRKLLNSLNLHEGNGIKFPQVWDTVQRRLHGTTEQPPAASARPSEGPPEDVQITPKKNSKARARARKSSRRESLQGAAAANTDNLPAQKNNTPLRPTVIKSPIKVNAQQGLQHTAAGSVNGERSNKKDKSLSHVPAATAIGATTNNELENKKTKEKIKEKIKEKTKKKKNKKQQQQQQQKQHLPQQQQQQHDVKPADDNVTPSKTTPAGSTTNMLVPANLSAPQRRREKSRKRKSLLQDQVQPESFLRPPTPIPEPGKANVASSAGQQTIEAIATNVSSGAHKRKRKRDRLSDVAHDRQMKRIAAQSSVHSDGGFTIQAQPGVGTKSLPILSRINGGLGDLSATESSLVTTRDVEMREASPNEDDQSGHSIKLGEKGNSEPLVTRRETPDARDLVKDSTPASSVAGSSEVSTDSESDHSDEKVSLDKISADDDLSSMNHKQTTGQSTIIKNTEPAMRDHKQSHQAVEVATNDAKAKLQAKPSEVARPSPGAHMDVVSTVKSPAKVQDVKSLPLSATTNSVPGSAKPEHDKLKPGSSQVGSAGTPQPKIQQQLASLPNVINSVPRAKGPNATMIALKRLEKFAKYGDENYPTSDEEDSDSSSSDESEVDVGPLPKLTASAERLSEHHSNDPEEEHQPLEIIHGRSDLNTDDKTVKVPAKLEDEVTSDTNVDDALSEDDNDVGSDVVISATQPMEVPLNDAKAISTSNTPGPTTIRDDKIKAIDASTDTMQPHLDVQVPHLEQVADSQVIASHAGDTTSPSKKLRRTFEKVSKYFPSPEKIDSSQKSKRVPAGTSAVPFPSIDADHFGVMQEKFAHDPFKLVLATMFLNKTAGRFAVPIVDTLVARYPTPELLAKADVEEVFEIVEKLGLGHQRSRNAIRLAQTWLDAPPTKGKRYRTLHYPRHGDGLKHKPSEVLTDNPDDCAGFLEIGHLHGCGPYAWDSWRISCRDTLRGNATSTSEPEWKRVLPNDKELRAYLRWKWLREGWVWDPLSGDKVRATKDQMADARAGVFVPPNIPEADVEVSATPQTTQTSPALDTKKSTQAAKRTLDQANIESNHGPDSTPNKLTTAENSRQRSSRKQGHTTEPVVQAAAQTPDSQVRGLQVQMSPSVRKKMRITEPESGAVTKKRSKTKQPASKSPSVPNVSSQVRGSTKLSATQQRDRQAMLQSRSQKNLPAAVEQHSNLEAPILISDDEQEGTVVIGKTAPLLPSQPNLGSTAASLPTPTPPARLATRSQPRDENIIQESEVSSSVSSADSPPLPPSSLRRSSSSRHDEIDDSEPQIGVDQTSAHMTDDDVESIASSSIESITGQREASAEL